jgi:hypothetical protein
MYKNADHFDTQETYQLRGQLRPGTITYLEANINAFFIACESVPEMKVPISTTSATGQQTVLVWGPCQCCKVKFDWHILSCVQLTSKLYDAAQNTNTSNEENGRDTQGKCQEICFATVLAIRKAAQTVKTITFKQSEHYVGEHIWFYHLHCALLNLWFQHSIMYHKKQQYILYTVQGN